MEFVRIVADAILAGSTDAVVASDRYGIIRVWNPGAAHIFGYTEAEAVGQSLDIITPERLRKRHWDGYRKTMATGESRYGEGALLSVPGVCKVITQGCARSRREADEEPMRGARGASCRELVSLIPS